MNLIFSYFLFGFILKFTIIVILVMFNLYMYGYAIVNLLLLFLILRLDIYCLNFIYFIIHMFLKFYQQN